MNPDNHSQQHMASATRPTESAVSASGNSASNGGRTANASTPSRYERLARLTGVQILATGSYVPQQRVTNEDMESWGYDADWIVQRTGIRERRRAADCEATSDLAVEAARACLDQAGIDAEQVDLILVASMTPDSPSPSTACLVQRRLGSTAPAMDLNAACAGFMYALVTGMQFVRCGTAQRVLVIGADVMSRIVDPDDKKTYPLFGDGAGAVLLGAGSESQGMTSYLLGSDGSGADLLYVPAGGSREPVNGDVLARKRQFMRMEGRAVFKWAVRTVHDASRRVLDDARIAIEDVSLVIMHQANWRILDAVSCELGIEAERVITNLDRYGNTSAASIPLVLDEVHRAGRLERGDRLLLSGFGAGLAWSAGVLVW